MHLCVKPNSGYSRRDYHYFLLVKIIQLSLIIEDNCGLFISIVRFRKELRSAIWARVAGFLGGMDPCLDTIFALCRSIRLDEHFWWPRPSTYYAVMVLGIFNGR